ncbi:MAG: preprotein translocase subunit SecE [Acidobacteria bacterium]|nr:preprotein translocase subunit SecE [Acidobacteriota bacterium]
MALNREQKRMLQRQGELGPDGEPLRTRRNPQSRAQHERTGPAQFAREVRSELRKVAWPTRSETINYSIITVVTLVVFTVLIFGLDWVFSELVLKLFNA